jgi:hypothetical protein
MKKQKNKGSIYFLALASAIVLLLVVLGIAAIILQFRHSSRSNTAIDQGYVYAELGISHALSFTHDTADWRNLLNNGTWLSDISAGSAVYSVNGIDPKDGILSGDSGDSVILTCAATVNGVTRRLSVTAQQQPSKLLSYTLAAGKTITIKDSADICGNVCGNKDIVKDYYNCVIDGNAEAVSTIQYTTNINGNIVQNTLAKSFPDEQAMFNYYKALATPISYRSEINQVLLSNTSNPYGVVNANGLYKMDCGNQKLIIKNCRIYGTLMLINPRNDSRIESCLNWQPARLDYPALIIEKGALYMDTTGSLSELVFNTDFNLPTEFGYHVIGQVFANQITGAVYIDGDLELRNDSYILGSVIVTGTVKMYNNTDIKWYNNCVTYPAKNFLESYLSPIQGTWQEPANP